MKTGLDTEELIIIYGEEPVHQTLHGLAHESRWAPTGQAVGCSHIIDSEVLNAYLIVQTSVGAQEHGWAMGWLSKDAMHSITEDRLEPESHTARRATDAAGQVDKERIILVHSNIIGTQLARQTPSSYSIAQEEGGGILIIDEVSHGIGLGLFPARRNCDRIVRLIFIDMNTIGAKLVFFPLSCIRRHMHTGIKAQSCTHDADGQPKVTSRTDCDLILAEEFLQSWRRKLAIIIIDSQQSGINGQVLSMLKYLVNAASRLDGSADRQFAVQLSPKLPRQLLTISIAQR